MTKYLFLLFSCIKARLYMQAQPEKVGLAAAFPKDQIFADSDGDAAKHKCAISKQSMPKRYPDYDVGMLPNAKWPADHYQIHISFAFCGEPMSASTQNILDGHSNPFEFSSIAMPSQEEFFGHGKGEELGKGTVYDKYKAEAKVKCPNMTLKEISASSEGRCAKNVAKRKSSSFSVEYANVLEGFLKIQHITKEDVFAFAKKYVSPKPDDGDFKQYNKVMSKILAEAEAMDTLVKERYAAKYVDKTWDWGAPVVIDRREKEMYQTIFADSFYFEVANRDTEADRNDLLRKVGYNPVTCANSEAFDEKDLEDKFKDSYDGALEAMAEEEDVFAT